MSESRQHPQGHCQRCGEPLRFVPCLNCSSRGRDGKSSSEIYRRTSEYELVLSKYGLSLRIAISDDQIGYLHHRRMYCLNYQQWLLRSSAVLFESDQEYLNAKALRQRQSRLSASHGSQHLAQKFRQAASRYLHNWGKYADFQQPLHRSSDTENEARRSLTHGGYSYDIVPASQSVRPDTERSGVDR